MQTANLLQRCQAGEAAAIQNLIETHQQKAFKLALSILDDAAEADEATQDAFLAALKGLESYRGDSAFTTWLYRIVINTCRQRLRKRRARERLNGALQSIFRIRRAGPTHPEEIVVQREARTALWSAVNALGERHRIPVILHYYHDLPVAEIAAVLGISEGTVLSRLFTARERLRAALNEYHHLPLEAGAYE